MSATSEVQVTPSARDFRGSSPLVAIENEPSAKLIVDPPLADPLVAMIKIGLERQSERNDLHEMT